MRRVAVSILAALTAFWLSVENGFAQRVVGTHPGIDASLALSPDGKTLASGGNSGTIQIWDYSTGTLIRTLDGNISEVDWMRFWPGSRYLINTSFSRLQAHDLKTGERLPISDQLGNCYCYDVALSPDRRTIAVRNEYSVVSVWDFLSGEMKGELEDVGVRLGAMVYSHDGLMIAAPWEDGVYIWNAETLRVKHRINIPGRNRAYSYRIAFLPDNQSMARVRFRYEYGDGTGTAEIWDVKAGEMKSSFGGDFENVKFSPDGRRLLTVNGRDVVTLWDVEAERILKTNRRKPYVYDRPFFSEDSGKLFVGFDSGFESNEAQIWDAETGEMVSTFAGSLYVAALSPDGRTAASLTTIALEEGYSRKTRIWDIETGELKGEAPPNNTPIASVSFSPDGRYVFSSPRRLWSGDGYVRIWDLLTGQEKAKYSAHGGQAAFSPDGRYIAAARYNGIQIRNAETGEIAAELADYRPSSLTFSPDGRSLAFIYYIYQGKNVHIWRIDSGEVSANLKRDQWGASSIAYSPDGNMLAIGGDDGAFLWDSESGDLIRTFADGTDVETLAFSPDGQTLMTGGEDSAARLWNVSSGALQAELDGHEGAVVSVAYSPDGARIAVADEDGTIRIWSAETYELENALTGHVGYVSSVDFSPDGRSLVSGGKDGRVLLWSVEDLPILWSDAKRPNSPIFLRNALLPTYPNPFNPETWIPFDLAQESAVTITIYDSSGQTVRRMELGDLPAGSYRAKGKAAYWDGRDALGAPAASGVYYVRIEAGGFSETRRMVLLK